MYINIIYFFSLEKKNRFPLQTEFRCCKTFRYATLRCLFCRTDPTGPGNTSNDQAYSCARDASLSAIIVAQLRTPPETPTNITVFEGFKGAPIVPRGWNWKLEFFSTPGLRPHALC